MISHSLSPPSLAYHHRVGVERTIDTHILMQYNLRGEKDKILTADELSEAVKNCLGLKADYLECLHGDKTKIREKLVRDHARMKAAGGGGDGHH